MDFVYTRANKYIHMNSKLDMNVTKNWELSKTATKISKQLDKN